MAKCNICGKTGFKNLRGVKIHQSVIKHGKNVHKTYAPDVASFAYGKSKRRTNRSTDDRYQRFYQLVEWARAAVDLISRSVITSGYRISIKHDSEVKEETLHVIEEFFEIPNAEDHIEDLLVDTACDLLVFGNSYWELKVDNLKVPIFIDNLKKGKIDINKPGFKFPFSIYIVDASTMEIQTDGKKIIGYVQKVSGGNDIPFSTDSIIHFKLPGAGSDMYGLSPMKTLQNSMASDLLGTNYNSKFFENDATPRLHIDIGNVKPEELKAFAARVEAKLKGDPHKNLVTSGGVTINPISVTNKDMEFDTYLDRLMKRIFAVYGIPPAVFGLGDLRELEQLVALFTSFTVRPLQKLIARRIDRKFMRTVFAGIPVKFEFNPIGSVDVDSYSQKEERDLKNALMTVNEIRKNRGLSVVDWGDVPIIPYSDANLAVLDKDTTKLEGKENKKDEGKNNES